MKLKTILTIALVVAAAAATASTGYAMMACDLSTGIGCLN